MFSRSKKESPIRDRLEFHHIKPEYATRSLSKAIKEGRITDDDSTLIQNHVAWVAVTSNISPGRVNKLTFHLVKFRKYLGPYRENTIDDIYRGIRLLKSDQVKGHPYSPNTLRDDIATLKKFYIWLVKKGFTTIPKEEIGEIKVPAGNTMTKTAAQMLTEEEIHAMIRACVRSMDRAFIAVCYEAALRIKEVGTLTWDQVSFGKNNVILNVSGKTGKPRHIPLVMSMPYLSQWRADYPLNPEGDAFVFISEHERKPFRYKALEKRLRLIASRAGVTKKVSPHLLRHTRITHLVQLGVREYSVREIGWGNQSTKMLSTYSHIANGDIDEEISRLYGIEPEDNAEDHALYPRQCPHCAVINAPTARYCASCGVPLTPDAKVTIDELTAEIEAHPLYKRIIQKVEELIMVSPNDVRKVGQN